MGNKQNNNYNKNKQYEIPFNKILNGQIEKKIKRKAKTPIKLNKISNFNSRTINNKSTPNVHKFYNTNINNKLIESIDFLINYINNKNLHLNKKSIFIWIISL